MAGASKRPTSKDKWIHGVGLHHHGRVFVPVIIISVDVISRRNPFLPLAGAVATRAMAD
jgi:hypothetical protein